MIGIVIEKNNTIEKTIKCVVNLVFTQKGLLL